MRIYFYSFFLIIFFTACHSKTEKEKLNIAVAANMQFAIEELVDSFSQKNDIDCNIILGSSGKLTAQIIQGAPFDIFLSADMKYPQKIHQNNKSLHPPTVYANGHLVLWTLQESLKSPLEFIQENTNTRIAIAHPENAPYGSAAMEVLRHYELPDADERLVYGESISQVNQFVATESVAAGFTSKSVVLSPNMKDRGQWQEIPNHLYTPIRQGIVLVRHREHPHPKAKAFQTFIFSDEAGKILNKFGYSVPD